MPEDLTGHWLVLDETTMGRYYARLDRRLVYCYHHQRLPEKGANVVHVKHRYGQPLGLEDHQYGIGQVLRLATEEEMGTPPA